MYDLTAPEPGDQRVVTNLIQRAGAGAVAGLVGGLVFGVLLGVTGLLSTVGMLIGVHDAPIGSMILHLIFSMIIGAGYGLVLGPLGRDVAHGWWTGPAYGVVWWVVGALVLMPTLLGDGVQLGAAFSPRHLPSLVGHLVYGLSTGLAYPALIRRI